MKHDYSHPDGFLDAVLIALIKMDKRFTRLSGIRFAGLSIETIQMLKEEKIQERPFAYEFYHQFRKLWESGETKLFGIEGIVIQAEVNKSYQNIPGLKKAPDFIIHNVGTLETTRQLGVIEFKLADNVSAKKLEVGNVILTEVQYDLDKLTVFQRQLKYKYPIEIVVGSTKELVAAKAHIDSLCDVISDTKNATDVIYVIYFDTTEWTSTLERVVFPKPSKSTGRRSTGKRSRM